MPFTFTVCYQCAAEGLKRTAPWWVQAAWVPPRYRSLAGDYSVVTRVGGLWTFLLLVWGAVGALLGNRPLLHAFVLAVTLLGVVWYVLSIFWEGAATPPCPGGVPSWWPSFIPAPGF